MTHPLVQLPRCGLFTSLVQTGNIIWTFLKEESRGQEAHTSPSASFLLPPPSSHSSAGRYNCGQQQDADAALESSGRTAARIKERAVGAPGQMRLSPAASGLGTGVQPSSWQVVREAASEQIPEGGEGGSQVDGVGGRGSGQSQ